MACRMIRGGLQLPAREEADESPCCPSDPSDSGLQAALRSAASPRGEFFWLDLAGPDGRTLAGVAAVLGLHELALEDTQEFGQRAAERLVELSGDKDEAAAYYRDIGDHRWRAIDDVDMARESLQGMVDTYSNEVQERLTIVATIFLPLSLLTGFFGMNFNWLISQMGPAWAFWGLGVGGLGISAVAIAVWLRRSGMYGGRSRSSAHDEAGRTLSIRWIRLSTE